MPRGARPARGMGLRGRAARLDLGEQRSTICSGTLASLLRPAAVHRGGWSCVQERGGRGRRARRNCAGASGWSLGRRASARPRFVGANRLRPTCGSARVRAGLQHRQLADWATGKTGPDVDTALAEMKRTRSLVHRLTVYWWDVQPVQGVWNENDWWRYDRVVNTAHKEGFRLILNPMGSPNWARQANRRVPDEFGGDLPQELASRRRVLGRLGHVHPNADPAVRREDLRVRDLERGELAPVLGRRSGSGRPQQGAESQPRDVQEPLLSSCGADPGRAARRARRHRRADRPRTTWISPAGTNRVREMRSSTFLNRAYDAGIAGCNPSFVGYHPYVYKSYCGANPTMASTPAFRELSRYGT